MSKTEEALRLALVGLNDWATAHAPDMCSEESVAEMQERIGRGGVLAYIAGITAVISDALSEPGAGEMRKAREA